MQILCTHTERVQRSNVRVLSAVAPTVVTQTRLATDMANHTVWNAMPSVPQTAICTHGKFYDWRLQEMPT